MNRKKASWKLRCLLCMVPSLAGTAVFFILPYIRVIYYSFIDNQFRKNFVWFENYVDTIKNEYFRIAFINSIQIIIICVPAVVCLAIVISIAFIFGAVKKKRIRTCFVLPMVIPTVSIAVVWDILFDCNSSVIPLYLLFVWKNVGICIILISAAFSSIDQGVIEAARIDGAYGVRLHLSITIPSIFPTVLFTTLLTIVNSFRIYKESYALFGTNYPPQHSYTLQYYMNNNFLKLDYQALSTSAVITSIVILLIVFLGTKLQRRFST